MDLSKIHCLTINYTGIANRIMCSVDVSQPAALLQPGETATHHNCLALWDTGATNSAITELQAKRMGLVPVGKKMVSGLGGTIPKNTYIIDVVLPNTVRIPNLSVTELDNPKNEKGESIETFGILIGMDIISMGDFSICHMEGKTSMSFRIPSMVKHDYVKEWRSRMNVQRGRR